MLNKTMVKMLKTAGFEKTEGDEWIQTIGPDVYQAEIFENDMTGIPTILVGYSENGEEIDWSEAIEFSSFIMLVK